MSKEYHAGIKQDLTKTVKDTLIEHLIKIGEPTNVKITKIERLDYGTKAKPEIIEGWLKVTYYYVITRE